MCLLLFVSILALSVKSACLFPQNRSGSSEVTYMVSRTHARVCMHVATHSHTYLHSHMHTCSHAQYEQEQAESSSTIQGADGQQLPPKRNSSALPPGQKIHVRIGSHSKVGVSLAALCCLAVFWGSVA